MKAPRVSCLPARSGAGFTLTELLVTITIIVILAAMAVLSINRMMVSGAKAKAINQMREIGVGVGLWVADKCALEPFYFTSDTGDFPKETLGNDKSMYTPGNPAKALYNMADPDSGYIKDPSTFYSPLISIKPPTRKQYNPNVPTYEIPWGTYVWHYPYVLNEKRNGHQLNIRGYKYDGIKLKVNPAIEGRFMMTEFYDYNGILRAKYGKQIYNALMSDGSVQHVADNPEALLKWKTGE